MLQIELINGYWYVNDKPINKCNFAEVKLFDKFINVKRLQNES